MHCHLIFFQKPALLRVAAYVSNFNNNTVSICSANPDGTFGACNPVSDPAFTTPLSAGVDPTGFYLCFPNFLNFFSTMAICLINPNGTLQTCTSNAGNSTFDFDSVNAINLFIRNSGGVNFFVLSTLYIMSL